jgi:carbamate kinase
MRPGERGTAAQHSRTSGAITALEPLLGAERLVPTHGNGPQVVNELIGRERAAEVVPQLPLWLAVAQTKAVQKALMALAIR